MSEPATKKLKAEHSRFVRPTHLRLTNESGHGVRMPLDRDKDCWYDPTSAPPHAGYWKIPDSWMFLGELIPAILAADTPLTLDVAGVIAEYIANDDTDHQVIVHEPVTERYPQAIGELTMTAESWEVNMGHKGEHDWLYECMIGLQQQCRTRNGTACLHHFELLQFTVPRFPKFV